MKLATISAEDFNLQAYTEPNASIYQSTHYADYMIQKDYKPLFLSYSNDLNVSTALAMLLKLRPKTTSAALREKLKEI